MSFCRFLSRNAPESPLVSIQNVVGAKGRVFHRHQRPIKDYRGPFRQHVLIIVSEGTAVLEREGRKCEAGTGDALLIGRGDQGTLSLLPCPDQQTLLMEIFTFDERSMAKRLRNHAVWESLAVEAEQCSPSTLVFRRFDPDRLSQTGSQERFEEILGRILGQYRAGLADFLRSEFYQSRWTLCAHLERFVTFEAGLAQAAKNYVGGLKQLTQDSRLFLGYPPGVVLNRRRCELATAWLRCRHSIDDVAKALGYSNRWEFECAYSGVTKKRCRDIQELPPLSKVSIEDLCESMLPFWWTDSRKLNDKNAPAERLFEDSVMSAAEENEFVAAAPKWQKIKNKNTQQRVEMTAALREKAADFFAMKSTGADVIVPIFKYARPAAMAA